MRLESIEFSINFRGVKSVPAFVSGVAAVGGLSRGAALRSSPQPLAALVASAAPLRSSPQPLRCARRLSRCAALVASAAPLRSSPQPLRCARRLSRSLRSSPQPLRCARRLSRSAALVASAAPLRSSPQPLRCARRLSRSRARRLSCWRAAGCMGFERRGALGTGFRARRTTPTCGMRGRPPCPGLVLSAGRS